jgi:hypothetical protein
MWMSNGVEVQIHEYCGQVIWVNSLLITFFKVNIYKVEYFRWRHVHSKDILGVLRLQSFVM